jgi:hypothetical protein
METAVVVALISSLSSLAVALWTRWGQRDLEYLRYRLTLEEKDEERRFSAGEELRRLREPLLEAANDLGHRVHNIRAEDFLAYLDAGSGRRDLAIQSTLYRLAKYFRTVEVLYEGGNPLRFERAEDTRAVASMLADIGRTFASDKYDRTDGFASSRFMIWREEQRAMGDSVRISGDSDAVYAGFTEFVTRLERGADKWFAKMVDDLENGDVKGSQRFALLQGHLATLVRELDKEQRYARGDEHEPDWLRKSPPTGPTDIATGNRGGRELDG